MERCRDGPGCAFAGRNHEAAVAHPRVHLWRRNEAHVRVIYLAVLWKHRIFAFFSPNEKWTEFGAELPEELPITLIS
jgi:hypothetical protein